MRNGRRSAAVPGNWLAGTPNPWNLAAPPAGFLRELAAFDPDAVIVPSQQTQGYWLTRRRRQTAGIMTVLQLDTDSQTFHRYGLIPVTCWGANLTWGAQVFQWLRDRDTWAVGGAKVANRILEAQDAAAEKATRTARNDENDARARSMYRTVARRSGFSVALSDVERGRGHIRPRRASQPHTSPALTPPTPAGWTSSGGSGLVVPPAA